MSIDVIRPRDLTAAQVARWSELQRVDPAFDSPFLSPQWARTVERAQAESARGLQVAVVKQDGRDVGFMAARLGAYTALPAGAPMCDYQALVAEPGLSVDPHDLVHAFGVHRFDFSAMLESQAAFAPYARGRTVSRVVDMAGGWGAYEAERRAAGVGLIKDIEKKRRKVTKDLATPVFNAFSRSSGDFERMIGWKRDQLRATHQTDIFETPWTQRLLRELFDSRDPEFGGALFTLHIGDKLAAAHFHVHGRRTVHAWIIAHDPAFERYSPGMMLFLDVLRWMDGTPYSRLDLGCGDQRFKQELSNAVQGVTQGFVGVPSAADLVRRAAYGVVAAAEALPLGPASHLPAKALRRMDQWRGLRIAR
ncbi:GNAT family N-acetyltransferase [Phenylobacterium sp.]|uniref:GNAT family N-acetyltransferase n=1 Tax=Phenylobacterium sp. TaxID=1871053 RepID=UPI0027345D10|nr:GNAT family N-acetyltransferase [Phenylobacterium sp.]MDP3661137.1 GNAT family N-acetyltransferase [Phenylobacterium sp.]